jgi:hypothetical protein
VQRGCDASGVQHVRAPERELERLRAGGVLVQQEAEVGGGRVGGGDRQQHGAAVGLSNSCSVMRAGHAHGKLSKGKVLSGNERGTL